MDSLSIFRICKMNVIVSIESQLDCATCRLECTELHTALIHTQYTSTKFVCIILFYYFENNDEQRRRRRSHFSDSVFSLKLYILNVYNLE